MSDYCISPEMSYQFIMSPFMSKVMAAADFIQTDVTYGENKFLPYLLMPQYLRHCCIAVSSVATLVPKLTEDHLLAAEACSN